MSRRPHYTARRIAVDQLVLTGKSGTITVTRAGGISEPMEEAFRGLMNRLGMRAAIRGIEATARRQP